MDFKKLNIGIEAEAVAEKAVTVTTFKPEYNGKPIMNGNGKPLEFHIVAIESPEGQQEWRRVTTKYGLGREQDFSEATDEDIDKYLKLQEKSGYELIIRLVKGWNLEEENGEAIPCTKENREAFFKAYEPVAALVSLNVVKMAGALGK